MKKTHAKYLQRVLNLSIMWRASGNVDTYVSAIRSPKSVIYRLIRDIVCDYRFYSVSEDNIFWKAHSFMAVSKFIDALTPEKWSDQKLLDSRKEEFLNEWFYSFCFPVSEKRRKLIVDEILSFDFGDSTDTYTNYFRAESMQVEHRESDLEYDFCHTNDCTETSPQKCGALPPLLKDYQQQCNRQMLAVSKGAVGQSHIADAIFLNRINRDLLKLAMKIGRVSSLRPVENKGSFMRSRRWDINGITVGDDLNSLLPAELAMLASSETEAVFYHRFVQKRLQIFASASSSNHKVADKNGPVYICMDTSSSMSGEPEVMAKSLALAVAILAQKTNRPVCIINYSFNVSYFVLMNLTQQRDRLLRFLAESYGGGNDEDNLFRFIFKILPTEERYKQVAGRFEGADLLIISDFKWADLRESSLKLIEQTRKCGLRIFSLMVGKHGNLHPDSLEHFFKDGIAFFESSDFRYTYLNGECRQLSSKKLIACNNTNKHNLNKLNRLSQ